MNTKIFCDIAEINQIKKFNKKKIVKGFTTNPSLMRKAGAKDYKSYAKKILKVCPNKPVSLEVFADDYINMKKQALKINTWGKNIYVKIPIVNSKGIFMGKVIKELNNQNIKLANFAGCAMLYLKIMIEINQINSVEETKASNIANMNQEKTL